MATIARLDTKAGCPSGLQSEPPSLSDPFAEKTDLSSFVRRQNGKSSLELMVQGAHCGGCVSKIEHGFRALNGVISAHMNLTTMRLRIEWDDEKLSAQTFIPRLKQLGFSAAPYEITQIQQQVQNRQKQLLKAMSVAGFAAMNVMLMSIAVWSAPDMKPSTLSLFHWLSAFIALPAVIYSGRIFISSAIKALKTGRTNMDVPISLALILACALSVYETIFHNPDTYFDAAVMLLFLLLVGRYLDARLRRKTGEAAEKLIALKARSATRILSNGELETIATTHVNPGDILLIPVGQSVPVDGVIIEGRSEIDSQIVTGETKPELKSVGDDLFSGTINLTGPLKIRAIARDENSLLSEISQLVALGEQSKSRFVNIADRAARLYVPIVHTLAALTFLGWLLAGADLRTASLCAIAVLIITCPCALGLAVPAVQIVASGRLFAQGILLKSGDALERLAKVNHVVFDKTGTLTTGEFELINESEISQQDLALAAALCRHSRHPVARALSKFRSPHIQIENVVEEPGRGLSGTYKGKAVHFMASHNQNNTTHETYTESSLVISGQPPIVFLFQDEVRESSSETITELREQGVSMEILSGDKDVIVKQVASKIGLEQATGQSSPAAKNERQDILTKTGKLSLMVGDGINDAPALANAYVSASLANGSDISRAAADIILQSDDLTRIPRAVDIAKKSEQRKKENLGFAIVYNLCAIPLAVLGFVNPLIAALAMSGSSLIVTLNALRMRRA